MTRNKENGTTAIDYDTATELRGCDLEDMKSKYSNLKRKYEEDVLKLTNQNIKLFSQINAAEAQISNQSLL